MLTRNRTNLVSSALLAFALVGCAGQASPVTGPAPLPALELEVFTAEAAGFHATSTLLLGEREAILIDAQFTLPEGRRLADQVAASGRELTTIYITHAHPDHYFGVEAVLERFPQAELVATAETVAAMQEMAPAKLAQWKPLYGDDLTASPLTPGVLTEPRLELEGHTLEIETIAQADMHPATIVRVPSLNALIVGDLAYDQVHVWLAETDAAEQREWLRVLEAVAATEPELVVAGHRLPGGTLAPQVLDRTADYIERFLLLADSATGAAELKGDLVAAFPEFALPVIAELSAHRALGGGQ